MSARTTSDIIKYTTFSALILSLFSIGFLLFTLSNKKEDIVQLQSSLTTQEVDLQAYIASSTLRLEEASTTIAALSSKLSLTSDELDELENDYKAEKNKNDLFEDQIKDITGTVKVLDKLSKTDVELLQKYSKVYFLNEHYVPEKIVSLEKKYLYNEAVTKSIHGQVEPFLSEMMDNALDDGVKIWVSSAYRSFNEQAGLKGSYTQAYGSGANAFSADQGYSEHQLGTTLDFTTEGIGGGLNGFDTTPAYTWLQKNAHKYGFTLSYPKNNAYYVFEPWHWRFVGVDLASDLHSDGKFFYDLEQREIDSYLIKIFD